MIDIISSRFEQEKDTKTYRRIDSQHPIPIYLGYNENGNKSLVVIGTNVYVQFKSTKLIDTGIHKRPDEPISVEFSLLDDRFSSMFYKYCEDIINSTRIIEIHNVIRFISNRWDSWRLLFKENTSGMLSENIIQGLIGELLFINKIMIPQYGVDRSIIAWEGPFGHPKDFSIDGTWYEIKASTTGNTVKINSIEQLDSEVDGFLVVVRLEKTNCQNDKAINLNGLVSETKDKIEDVKILKEFLLRLSEIQYTFDEYYDTVCFEYISMDNYKVNDNFPRIRRKDIPKSITKVQYELFLED